jgi:catechol 2,3-dioxygenase-like lactoylglutathione lyase family enzyme
MLDHIGIRAQDFPRLVEFYKAALAPIGYDVQMEFPGVAGMGTKGKPDFWLSGGDGAGNPTHVAFTCTRAQVDAFHAAALSAGGTDNGPPGIRQDYHPNYYAAFILDPEGNNVEAVCHSAPDAEMMGFTAAAAGRKPARAKAAPKKKSAGAGAKKAKAAKPAKPASSAKKKAAAKPPAKGKARKGAKRR